LDACVEKKTRADAGEVLMKIRALDRRSLAIALAFGVATALAGCGSKEEPAATTTTPPAATPEAAPAAPVPTPVSVTDVANATWTAEALEELLAPIALYPDPVLSQLLIASTNPQEVLDAGNWLIANEGLEGKALDDGAAQAGFTPPIRALVQFPQTIDMMCMEMGWTTELGQAFVADQAGVLAAVQRLRKQAMDVGNLKSSEAMLVETQQQEGQEVVVLKPPKPEVVYVPTYDPQAVYAPAPAAAAAPAATTTTTTTTETSGHSTGTLVTTGLLAFGAGMLVNEIFDDDDDYHGYNYPNYGYGGMPYYPPYPYRPSYGGGYYLSNGYNRPPNYNSGFQNTGNIYVNTGGNRPGGNNNNYWNKYDDKPRPGSSNNGYNKARKTSSPITQARPNRPELNDLSKRQPRPMPADVKRPAPDVTASNWKGQQSYAGKDKRPASAQGPQERINAATPGYSRPASNARPSAQNKVAPKVQGSYAGKDKANRPSTGSMPGARDLQKPSQKPMQKPATRDMPKPQQKPVPSGDRGYGTGNAQRPSPKPATKPTPMNRPSPGMQQGGNKARKGTAMSGANSNRGSAGAASQRGKQSMPQGARSKGGGGGGGGGKKKAR
jgi:hypothetical protein